MTNDKLIDDVALRECPFCGGEAEFFVMRDVSFPHRVRCKDTEGCGTISSIGTAFKNDKYNASRWNTRTTAQPEAALLGKELSSIKIKEVIIDGVNHAKIEAKTAHDAKPTEIEQAASDALITGTGFMKDGKRIAPEDVYAKPTGNIAVEKCSCGDKRCTTYWLSGIGSFCQGSGFEKSEAELIARLLNTNGMEDATPTGEMDIAELERLY